MSTSHPDDPFARSDNPVTRLILVRHGQTDWNVELRYQGQTDVPLNDIGQAQVEALGRRLASEHLDAIHASDLQRAWSTAEAVAAHHEIDVQPDARLREILIGEWEGLTYAEMQARDPERLARWFEDPARVSSPGGETVEQLAARMGAVLEELRAGDEESTVLLASHGGALRVMLCLALGMPPAERWRLRLDGASVSELHLYKEGAILTLLNDTHHLAGIGQ